MTFYNKTFVQVSTFVTRKIKETNFFIYIKFFTIKNLIDIDN